MNWCKQLSNCSVFLVGLTVLIVPGVIHAQDEMAKGARLPLEVYDNGQVKVQVTAKKIVPDEVSGHWYATDVRIEMFTEDGGIEGVITAESCNIDQQNEVVTSTTKVSYKRDGLSISGTGFEWHGTNQSFRILKDAKVVFHREAVKGLKRAPVAAN